MLGLRGRLSGPAIVIAIVALVAAMSGAALAGPSAKKVTTKKVKKIADKEIAKAAPGLSVAHAGSADSATTAANATQADSAGTANGVKPININFTGTGPGLTNPAPVNQGGIRIDVGCNISTKALVELTATANNGSYAYTQRNANGVSTLAKDDDFDIGDPTAFILSGSPPFDQLDIDLSYKGADGTSIVGHLLLLDPSAFVTGCADSGTLFLSH